MRISDWSSDVCSSDLAHRPTPLVHRVVQRHSEDRFAVDVGDVVAWIHAGTMGRGIVDWRDNLDEDILHGDLDTTAAALDLGLHLPVAVGFRPGVAGVRVACRVDAPDDNTEQIPVAAP